MPMNNPKDQTRILRGSSENPLKPEFIDKSLFVNGKIIDPEKKTEKVQDVVIINGKIESLGKIDPQGFDGRVIDISGKVMVPGLIDMHVHLREPGREDEETLSSGAEAAMAGGFTAVCPMPNTEPPVDNREVIEFIKDQFKGQLVDVFPIAAVTKGRRGEELTEMAELVEAGSVAFSDDRNPVSDTGVLRRALEYARMFDVPIIDHCEELSLSRGGVMNEGFVSTNLGLSGMPCISEEIMVARDLMVAHYTKGKIHIPHVSTARSVELIRRAKEQGVNVSCEVTPHHFTLTDEILTTFDSNMKMNPPLRTAEDVAALKEGLQDGTIDVIATDHAPHSVEEKEVEFSAAPFGIIGLETALGLVITQLVEKKVLTLPEAIAKMTVNPARVLGLEKRSITPGQKANITIFDPSARWVVDKSQFRSRSRNSPFHGWELTGRVSGIMNNSLWLQLT